MYDKEPITINLRQEPGSSLVERELGLSGADMECIARELSPNRKFVLKVLKRQFSSDLEYLTIRMGSTHPCSDELSQNCQ